MATISRRLLPKNRYDEQQLVFIIKHGKDIRLDYPSGIRLNKDQWTSNKLAKKTLSNYKEVNAMIASMEAKILLLINRDVISNTKTSKAKVKGILDSEFNRTESEINKSSHCITFFEFCDRYIKQSEVTKRKTTVYAYKHTVQVLKSFNAKLDFDDIDLEFYSLFVSYLRDTYYLTDNSIGKDIKNIKAILNAASDAGYKVNMAFKSKSFKTFRFESENIYLTNLELLKLHKLDLSSRANLDRVCDLFLVGCHTGLRYSDLQSLSRGNIVIRPEGSYITKRTLKTDKKIIVPINNTVQAIIDKYNGEFPEAISNQKMNAALKTIGQLAGLDELVQITQIRAGVSEKQLIPKYKLITTHTARRSFATNAYLAGVPSLAIMKITGHKSESSFMKYIKGSQEENAIVLSCHPFFK